MKKKYLDETYLRSVDQYQIKEIETPEEYIVFKHFLNVKQRYIESHTRRNICLQDNGYYMIEYLPKRKNYAVRSFIDKDKKVLRNYIDIVNKSGREEDTGRLYYEDMYLDIVEDIIDGKPRIQVRDFTDLEQAQIDGKVSQEEANRVYIQTLNIIDELEAGNNKYVNLDPKKCLENIFDNVKIINIDRKEEEPNR